MEKAFFTTPNDDLCLTVDEVKALVAETKPSIAAAGNFMKELSCYVYPDTSSGLMQQDVQLRVATCDRWKMLE